MPPYYIPQIQLLMEIFDVDACDFVQYFPGTAFADPQFDITTVPRDRSWWAQHSPTLLAFATELQRLLDDKTAAAAWLLANTRPKRSKPSAAAARLLDSPTPCQIDPLAAGYAPTEDPGRKLEEGGRSPDRNQGVGVVPGAPPLKKRRIQAECLIRLPELAPEDRQSADVRPEPARRS